MKKPLDREAALGVIANMSNDNLAVVIQEYHTLRYNLCGHVLNVPVTGAKAGNWVRRAITRAQEQETHAAHFVQLLDSLNVTTSKFNAF